MKGFHNDLDICESCADTEKCTHALQGAVYHTLINSEDQQPGKMWIAVILDMLF